MKFTLIAEQLFDGESFHQDVPVTIEDGLIASFDTALGAKEVRYTGTLVPGFIDVQVNGGGGALFNTSPTVACIETIGKAHARFGTTGFLPTLITDNVQVMAKAADAVALAVAQKSAGVLGVHFEGPHLSVPKKGVHPQGFIREITEAELAIFCRQDLGIRVVTLAPENVSPEVIRLLVESGVKVCLGHSNADYDTVVAALKAGATGFTHLYNAMSPLGSREPGVVGAAIESETAWCGLIVDGHHVHPAAARIALRAKPRGKMMLVTDAMPPVGMDDETSFELFGTQVLRVGDRLNAVTGELAGCVLDMASAVHNTVNMLGLPLGEALRMAALYPAEFLGIADSVGRLAVGQRADLVLLDNQYQVLANYIAGNAVYVRP
ncbi:N-acetylglucosamine-6-phosphate deacetylase [Shewanella oneidensis MR-1]|uniref:N-acetylgalactosamine-6-phosphate deacetylase n=1 Tax=Shewanella oneidensis (strain ATCC 700550 / JCM 31522 / CIP 106686 / LMG 19005 / NCIMB 14063 / MR-1) TaxID=211586 RepID=Q8EBK8_SHEON|nr:N-acetylglucosamine-6-phosphate deacetylase [Shewanella oneidensis]AAN56496.1 N-acetylglucosamine-6-phosphate deacetylase NagA [Shewanella oneidensis MR-1]MDX5999098.1 N-acetylglucosamine-6-phosphate deacetylase [Shewanella oneidensis]MEE2029575.1 N-acetylgalactosamine-6-phosphate deacetylase [Shewanella oneidensis]QKG97880.1 N-acetylglucosamine-6-phosphate deacetylase [Shewanella oneidensis MR-1]